MSEPRITAENVLNRAFTANRPNEKWLTDVTEFKLLNGKKAYLSAILDLHDKSIVAYALGQSNNKYSFYFLKQHLTKRVFRFIIRIRTIVLF